MFSLLHIDQIKTLNEVLYSSVSAIFNLRLKQAERIAYGLGSYAVLIVLAGIVIIIYSYFLQQKAAIVQGMSALACVGLVGIHRSRKDLRFLQLNISGYQQVLRTEYFLILLPFLITGLPGGHFIYWLPAMATAIILPWFTPQIENKAMNGLLRWIPLELFEWRSGLRKMWLPVYSLYLAAWAGVRIPYLSLFLLWLVSVLAMSFFDHNEDLAMLTERGGSAKRFLQHKLILHLSWVSVWFMPVVVLHLYFHWVNALVIILITLGMMILWAFAILAKYSHYAPGYHYMKQSNFTAVIALLSILPFGFIFPALYSLYYYFKAMEQLKPYFDD